MLTAQVIGNLGGDPEIKETQGGTRLCRFSVASNKKIKGEKVTTWVNVTIFDPHKIEFASNWLRKGAKVFCEGEPQARAWQPKDGGDPQASLDLVLSFGSKLEICSTDGADSGGTAVTTASKPAAKKPAATPAWGDLDDDDIPFS